MNKFYDTFKFLYMVEKWGIKIEFEFCFSKKKKKQQQNIRNLYILCTLLWMTFNIFVGYR